MQLCCARLQDGNNKGTDCSPKEPEQLTATTCLPPDNLAECSLSAEQQSDPNSQSPALQQTPIKWACQMCTYLNWPKSRKCVQCLSPRTRSRRASRGTPPPTTGATSTSAPTSAGSASSGGELGDKPEKGNDDGNSSSGTSSRDRSVP